MATSVAALQVTVGADISKALSGLNRINSVVSSAGGFFGRAASTAVGFGAAMVGLNVLGSVAGAMHDTVGGAIALNSNLETNAIAFETLLGSGQKAQAFLGDLSAFAASTPFTLPDLETDSKRLLAFGFASDQVIPLLTDMGNAASALGTGQEGINRMSLALGQMLAKGKVQGDELLQLTESGVNVGQVFDIMSKQTGKSVAALQKLQAAGKLDPKLFIAAFQTFSQTRFAGLMEKQAQSFQGIWENVGETLNFARGAVFAPLFQMLKDLGNAILTFTKTPAFAAWVGRLQGWVGTGTTILGAWASTWSNLMKNNGLSFFQAGLTSTEMVINAVFGPAAAGTFHNFIAILAQIPAFVIGTLIPGLLRVATWVQTTLLPALARIGAFVLANIVPIIAFIAAFQGVLQVGALIAGVAAALAFLLSPIGLIAIAVGLLTAAWVTDFGGIQGIVLGFWAIAQPILTDLWTWLSTNLPAALGTLAGFWTGTLLPAITEVWAFVSTNLLPLFAAVGGLLVASFLFVGRAIGDALGILAEFGALLGSALLPPLQALWAWLSSTLLPVFNAIGAGLTAIGQGTPAWLQGLTTSLNVAGGQIAATPVGGLPTPLTPWERGVRNVDNSVTVTMTGDVNASDPADVQRFLDQIGAAAVQGQASAANIAPAGKPGAD